VASRPPKRGRDDDNDERSDGSDEFFNDMVCEGCGDTAAMDCAYGMCCHYCKATGGGGDCLRHSRFY
jgi:hypothetical protein